MAKETLKKPIQMTHLKMKRHSGRVGMVRLQRLANERCMSLDVICVKNIKNSLETIIHREMHTFEVQTRTGNFKDYRFSFQISI